MCRRLIFLICVVLALGLAPSALAALPAGWSSQDIGAVAAAGSANESAGVWTLTASGADIWGTADEFHYAYATTKLRGDCEIRVRVATITGGAANTRKAGVMIRETLDPGSRDAYAVARPGTSGGYFQWRPATGGGCWSADYGDPDIPVWVRLVRRANRISAWSSTNGTAWTQQGGYIITMAAEVYVGLCLTSHEDGVLTTATFDSLSVVQQDPGAAYNPSPADRALKVDINADLAWTAGDGATSHEVYFGTAASAMALVATNPLGSESYDPGTLAYNTDYYWQIVEVGGAAGTVWTFATVPDPAVTSDPDLVGYYKLQGNGDDSSGYANHGAVLGNPTWVDGLPGNGQTLALDGNGDCVNIGRGARDSYNFTGSFSISAWVNISEMDWWGNWLNQIVGKRGEESRSWVIRRHSSLGLSFTTRGVGNDDTRSVANPPLGQWLHITAVYDMAQNKKFIYFNGVKDQEATTTAGLGVPVPGSDHDVYIGARANSGNTGPERHFTGMIDEVRLYSRALSAAEVATLAMHSDASGPSPADGSKVDAESLSLEWDPGKSAAFHDVYFSDNFDEVDTADNSDPMGSDKVYKARQSELKYPPGPFDTMPVTRGATYYWRIDEVNGVDTWRGEIWSFTVVPNLNCSPSPTDLAKFVPVTADLSWTKGGLALVGHIVYLSTDFNAVDSIAPGTMTGPEYLGYTSPETATSIVIPGDLLSGTTYYWRADPIESSSPLTVHKGEVWSFTTASKYTGSILREWWLGVNGGGIANLLNSPRYPSRPDGAALLGLFEGPSTFADNYGSRYRGWLLVQRTGYYKFWSVSDDNSQLFLSTDEDPANAVMISQTTASAGARAWDDTDVTTPVLILLEGGKAYYIYALHKEGTGGDNMAVGWLGPDSNKLLEVIPGSHLLPYMPAAINPSPANGAKDLPLAGTMLSWTAGFDAATFGDYASQRVYFGTDATALEDKGAPTGTNSYGPVSLDYYKQYFWRIDGVTGGGQAVKGTVWSFTAIYDASQIVDPNLVGWWKLDGNADDSSGYGNHGIENGSPLYVDAVDDLGIDFDGVNDYINCGNSPRLNMNTNITVACWVKGPLGQSWSPFVSKRGEDSLGWKLRRQGGTNNACFTLRGTSGADDQQGNININDNEWHHVAGTYNGAQRNLYVDGQLDTGGSLAETGAIPATPGDDVVIGAFSRAGQSPSVQTYTDATIDDARIYNRALTQADIAKVMRINVAWAWKPDPKKGATGVSIEAVLSWTPGDYALPPDGRHYVSFGPDDPTNMVPSGPQAPNNYTPSALDLDTKYYWAVDEVNAVAPGGADNGPIWSFTTANNVVVDDMEHYQPALSEPNIYQVWVDGAGDCASIPGNNSGALTDIATTPVHGGLQAMKLLYDNDGTVNNPCDNGNPIARLFYSKTEAQVAQLPSGIASDWTIGGAKALSLWFYGDPLNSVESMWVQLTDGSDNKDEVLYGTYVDEDANDMNEASWHEWLIDLADFTDVNLTDVKSIAIRIGDEDAPSPGGTGILYFDDIRLYAPRCILVRREADFAPFDYISDCRVDYRELERMADQWLVGNEAEVAWAPSSTWDDNDIGSTATAGGFIDNGDGSYSVTGSGADIWGTADAFHYVYKPLVGDGQMTVNVVGMTGTSTNVWQKAGVMIRETLAPGSRNVMMAMSVGPGAASTFAGGDAFQWRPVTDQASSSSHVVCDNIEVLMPNCVRLVRTGNMFSGFVYVNGEWVQEAQTVTIAMPETVYIGLAVTSHDNAAGIYTTATFNSVCDSSFGGLLPELTGDDLVNFTDYAALMDRFLDEDFFP